MNVHIPWGVIAIAVTAGYLAGLITALPLLWWATRETKTEKAARVMLAEKIPALFPIPDPPPPEQRPDKD